MIPERIVGRFQERVGGDPDACWEWPMSVGSHGYGQMGWIEEGKRVMALTHRLAWQIYRGPIPAGLTIDHICRNRPCCNPSHLRLLTNEENGRDNGYATRTHCPRGHPYSGDNLYVDPVGYRRCRECDRIRQRQPKSGVCGHARTARTMMTGWAKCTDCGELIKD